MKVRLLAAGLLAWACAFSASADTITEDLGGYQLTYDNSTFLGGTAYSFSSGGNTVGFGWNLPVAIQVVSTGSSTTASFALPDFTVTANAGYILQSPMTGFLGNLVFNEVTGATSASVDALTAINGSSDYVPVSGLLDRFETVTLGEFRSGYYSGTATLNSGSFTSFSVKNAVLTLNASSETFASIIAQPQNELKISFVAAPVPEPETYAMMLAGIGLLATIARRRNKRSV